MAEPDFVLVLTTLSTDTDVGEFANALINERLAACVSVQGPTESVYRWGGRIERDTERQVVIKTTAARVESLWNRVRELHPYEVPEFLVIPVIDGNDAYLRWIRDCTKGSDPAT